MKSSIKKKAVKDKPFQISKEFYKGKLQQVGFYTQNNKVVIKPFSE